MPPKPSPNMIAGSPRRAAARAPDAGQRRHPAEQQARDLSDAVDQLLRLESLGPQGVAQHERKIALVEKIAAAGCQLREYYRGPSTRPCRPPLFVSADGTQAGW